MERKVLLVGLVVYLVPRWAISMFAPEIPFGKETTIGGSSLDTMERRIESGDFKLFSEGDKPEQPPSPFGDPLDPTNPEDRARIDSILDTTYNFLRENGLGNQVTGLQEKINIALADPHVEVLLQDYGAGRSSLIISTENLSIFVHLTLDVNGNVAEAYIDLRDSEGNYENAFAEKQDAVLPGSLELEGGIPGTSQQEAGLEEQVISYFRGRFGIEDPATQFADDWDTLVENWGNWTIAGYITGSSILDEEGGIIGETGTATLIFTYGDITINLSFDISIDYEGGASPTEQEG